MLTDTVIVGANGRLGRAMLARCAPGSSLAGLRSVSVPGRETPIGDAGFLNSGDLAGKKTVINCAAIASGSEAELFAVNADLPEKLAAQAREAGVRNFVQISSFRVYGRAERIGRETGVNPVSAYGRSKREGERRARALETEDFKVACLRLPFLFGAEAPSMLARLVGLLARTRVMPVPAPGPERAMLTFADAAWLIERIVSERVGGIVHAADPTPFTFELLADIFRTHAGRRLSLVRMPRWLAALAGRAVPRIQDSLYSSETLDPEINFAAGRDLPAGLEKELIRLVRRQCRIAA